MKYILFFFFAFAANAQVDSIEVYSKISFKDQHFGLSDGKIVKFDESKNEWNKLFEVPYPIYNLTVFNENLIASGSPDISHYKIDTDDNVIVPYTLPIRLFNDKKIKKISLSTGFSGCFNSKSSTRDYIYSNGNFKFSSKSGNRKALSAAGRLLDGKKVHLLADEVDRSRTENITVADLGITPKDSIRYSDFIAGKIIEAEFGLVSLYDSFEDPYRFPPGKNGVEYYLTVFDSLENMPQGLLDEIFEKDCTSFSTLIIWNAVTLEFEDGSKLNLSNNEWIPNYLNLPWLANYNGLLFKCTSIKAANIINDLSNGLLIREEQKDKNFALYQIADYLHKASVNNRQQ